MTIKLKRGTPKNQQFSVGRINSADRILFQAIDKTNLLFTLASEKYGGSENQISTKIEADTSEVTVHFNTDHIRRLKDGNTFRLINFTADNATVVLAEGVFTFTDESAAQSESESLLTSERPVETDSIVKKQKGNK